MSELIMTESRQCFLCGSSKGKIYQNEIWDITGIGKVRKGFRVCSGCGAVLQDPVIPKQIMSNYYKNFSNYTNPGTQGKPSFSKIRAVDCQLEYLSGLLDKAGTCLQVGSSEGYTLSRFEQLGWSVKGCDPSNRAAEIAIFFYGISTFIGEFENFPEINHFDLVIMTHVLEHLYDPVNALLKSSRTLKKNGSVFIEVPFLTESEYLPPGYLSFEHINYFTEATLRQTLNKAGFELVTDIEIELMSDQYPLLRVLARKARKYNYVTMPNNQIFKASNIIKDFAKKDAAQWAEFEHKVTKALEMDQAEIIIWGAGIHTSMLFARTSIGKNQQRIVAIVDSDPQKTGICLKSFQVQLPQTALKKYPKATVIISTWGGEKTIYTELMKHGWLPEKICLFYDSK